MSVTATGWANKKGTAGRSCKCGSWKQHWLNSTKKSWPKNCSVKGCSESPTLGAHIYNPDVTGEKIVPMCSSCNGLDSKFDLKIGITLVSANKLETCES
jgi:hypothetical protein